MNEYKVKLNPFEIGFIIVCVDDSGRKRPENNEISDKIIKKLKKVVPPR